MTVNPLSKQEMIFLGGECHHPACHLHDFLPFECPACHLSFCQPHFLPSQHTCTAPLPPSMIDRIAPQCPLCKENVPLPKTHDPNEAVERHILSGTCVAMEGGEMRRKAELRLRKERGEVCWRKGCNKSLVVKMTCESCGHQFCPSHRYTTAHNCRAPSGSSSRSATPQPYNFRPNPTSNIFAKSAISRLLPQPTAPSSKPTPAVPAQQATPISAQLDARAAAAAAAFKRAGQDVKAPFVKSKVEKRAKDELSSTIQALKTRHDKGLLTPADEVRLRLLLGAA
ncbi:hypothetical protein M231_01715 [Tremella mesenterica]|uniref:AN1-type domain-containing protein n=1 Tax=Tremella mesenterica TaxID=5217 RepID=A0A4Q1BSR8_TREME|nr:hypothetical protein M231_01715 [Tremella mesenterica]